MKLRTEGETLIAKQARETFDTFINEEESRHLLYNVLDKIREKTHPEGQESKWAFYSEDFSKEMSDVDLEKLDNTLQFLFNVKWFRIWHPSLNKPKESQQYVAVPRKFSSTKVENAKTRYEILTTQIKLRRYIQDNIPNDNVILDKKQIEETKSLLGYLKELHEKTTQPRTWEEALVAYFMLKSSLKRNPRQYEVSEVVGLSDYRFFRGRTELSREIEKKGFKLKFSYHDKLNFEEKSKKVKRAYDELKKQEIILTIPRIARKAGLSRSQAERYVKELKLEVIPGQNVSRIENTKKVKQAYGKLHYEVYCTGKEIPEEAKLYPTAKEIAEETKLSTSTIRKICKQHGLKFLPDPRIGLRIMYKHIKDFIESGRNISEMSNPSLEDYILTKGVDFSHNTIKKWRYELEDRGMIPKSRRREEAKQPPKHLKYQQAYLELVKEKLSKQKRIVLTRVAEELSRQFGEAVPEHRIWKLRDVTGIPVLLDNEARYQNIVDVYKQNPKMHMEEWADEARVSTGFLYDALRQFRKHPDLIKKFGVPYEMLDRLETRENPLMKAFKAIGNTNRVKIIKSLIQEDGIGLDRILNKLGYDISKWTDTFEYHLEVLEDADIVTREDSNIFLTGLGKSISSNIDTWDIDEIVPEEIFGPGYNKPLFTLAIGGGGIKALKEIVKYMREEKGRVPFDVPSAEASERHPVTDYLRHRFKKYLSDFLGKYQIKEEHLPFLGPLIVDVRTVFSPKTIPDLCKRAGIEYMRVRDITVYLADKGSVDEFYLQMPREKALKYMEFIKDNFSAICQRVKLHTPQKNVKLEEDRHNEIYSLKLC
jgi:DNA-binding transcriptional regulator YhcF (GntR family)